MRKDLRNRDSVSRGRDHLESRRRSRSPLRAHQCEVSTVSSREPHAYTEAPKLRDDESKNVLLCNLEGQPTGGICSTGSVIENSFIRNVLSQPSKHRQKVSRPVAMGAVPSGLLLKKAFNDVKTNVEPPEFKGSGFVGQKIAHNPIAW
ncbi:hypothetical protein FBUS_09551 [Fasciolopsis buskii]|uniref:Uncharacterized protein n=1 Tax=Fasciolopsis buskii TaxID=27845 RepID=A0A8E0RSF7_9TREM|nr:hypothetical protein FBUS_09551 [Fasciolopsis buski]